MKRKKQRLLLFLKVASRPAILIAFVLVLIFFIRSLLAQLLLAPPTFQIPVPEQVARAVPDTQPFQTTPPESAPIFAPALDNSACGEQCRTVPGSFTELFSGTGWKNEKNSTAYEDTKTTMISFPPAYSVEDVSASIINNQSSISGETIIAAKGNGKEVVLVSDSGKIFRFRGSTGFSFPVLGRAEEQIEQIGQIGKQLENAALDYDDSTGNWVVAAATADGGIGLLIINNQSSVSNQSLIINNQSISLACGGGECLVSAGTTVYRFAENNLSAAVEVGLPKEVRLQNIVSVSVGKAGNVLFAGAVKKINGMYDGEIFKYLSIKEVGLPNIDSAGFSLVTDNLFSSQYKGTIRFGYNPVDGKVLAVYAAYIGQAFLLPLEKGVPAGGGISSPFLKGVPAGGGISSPQSDFSRFFPQRVMEGQTEGEVRVDPDLFFKDGTWWVGSSYGSQAPKLLRIENGVANDLTDDVLSKVAGNQSLMINNHLLLASGFGARQIYLIVNNQSSVRIFRLTDSGFNMTHSTSSGLEGKAVWESINLIPWDGNVVRGRIFRADAGVGQTPVINNQSSASIKYFLSNDGGADWTPAKLGETINFTNQGKDFRFRIELSPSGDKFESPWVDNFGAEYSVVKSR